MKNDLSRRTFIASAAASLVPAAMGSAQPRSGGLLSMFADEPQASAQTLTPWQQAGVIDLNRSPHAKLKTVPVNAVTIQEGFWSKRRLTNVDSSIPSMHDELLAHGRMDNFLRLEGRSTEPQKGPVYSDSDIYKWLEAVGFALQTNDPHDYRKTADGMIHDVVAAQEPSGYLNTYYQGDRKSLRMTYPTQTTGHELYNIGHMLQGSIAYYRATGDRTMLDSAMRFIDGFLIPNYGPDKDKKGIVAGHPEIEMALIELSRTTGKPEYIELAGYILHGDDRIPLRPQQIVYMFCGIPFTSRTKLEGHAVRAMYACCGATDYYLETGDPEYWKTLNVLWSDLSEHQLYVTGGVGAREAGEAFGDAYELPNATAYGESCAAIGNMMWNWRMLTATGDAKYADVIERALYNGINSGMSLDGTLYCYRNPLAFDPSGGDKIRNPWYDTTCCPPNLERTFASLPGYFYSTSKDGLYLHLYDNSELDWHLEDGSPLKVVQQTRFPWDGSVAITVTPQTPKEFTFYLRIPAWSIRTEVKVNGASVSGATPGQYLPIQRRWAPGDAIHVSFDMTPQVLEANKRVVDDYGRVALQRGPLVYCLEELDQPAGVPLYDVSLDLRPAAAAQFHQEFRPDLLGGIVILKHVGAANESSPRNLYYRYAANSGSPSPVELTFIPYYAWANRAATPMQVWTPYLRT